ncbi:MAG: FG-GAP-like repeat-containing protein, partial [Acidobacteriota bacterium]|nr:FG-GAP-like repeat-containing protein [Acidobacteriota bacterium]
MYRIACAGRTARRRSRAIASLVAGFLALAVSSRLGATSIIPISDAELLRRADVVVHGIVLSSDVTVDSLGRPETLSIIQPLAVLKGRLTGSLVLHQLGGELPDGTFFKMWGRPEYVPGREVIVFAIARRGGEHETAEMLLGKFEVAQDEAGNRFAVSELAAGIQPGVDVVSAADEEEALANFERQADRPFPPRRKLAGSAATFAEAAAPRPLRSFLANVRRGVFAAQGAATVLGSLKPVEHASKILDGKKPLWGNINNSLYRWNNNATAAFTLVGTANMTGGGIAEATAALAAWTNEPHSTINYTVGPASANTIDLNAAASTGCGWSTCLAGGGVIGCGGPNGSGSNTFRGDTYFSISGGFVQLRCLATPNLFSSAGIQAVLEHELGHTLGLGHSDQNVSTHDTCRGDEDAAIMRSVVQSTAPLGTDDTDAVRWLYGDGLTSCAGSAPVQGDFDRDGKTDILWRNDATGSNVVWLMNGTSMLSAVTLPAVTDLSWQIVATADLNQDGNTDIIWRNSISGSNVVWYMVGTNVSSTAVLPACDPSWSIAGMGDFNGDGKPDILWRHSSGTNGIWFMNG